MNSLTKGEKWKFRKSFSSKNPPEFILLYDWIIKKGNPSQDGMHNFLGKDRGQLGKVCKRLWNELCEYLNLKVVSTSRVEYDSIILAQEFIHRKCYFSAQKLIQAGKKACEKSENLNCLLELFKWEGKLPWDFRSDNYEETLTQAEAQFFEFNELLRLSREIPKGLKTLQNNQPQIDFLTQLAKREILQNPSERQSSKAKFLNLLILRKVAQLTHQFEKALFYSQKIMSLLEKGQKMIEGNKEKELEELTVQLFLHDQLDNKDGYQKTLFAISTFNADSPYLEAKKIVYFFLPRLVKLTELGKKETGIALIADFLPLWEGSKELVSPKERLMIVYRLAKFFWTIGEGKRMNYWLGEANKYKAQKPDLYNFLFPYFRVMEICHSLDLGEFSLAESRMNSLSRNLDKNGIELHYFELLFRSSKLILNSPLSDSVKELPQILDLLLVLKNDPKEIFSFAFIDISLWIEARMKRTPIHSILTNRSSLSSIGDIQAISGS